MKPRFPLYAKILLWFFLNLLLLALVGWITLRVQLRPGLDSFLSGYVGERMEAITRDITVDLQNERRSEWDEILKRYSDRYGVQFLLINDQQEPLAGNSIPLPVEVR